MGIAILILAASSCVRKTPEERDLVLAIIGERRVRGSDFRRELDRLDPSLRSRYSRDRMALLNKMIEDHVIYQKAVEKNVSRTREAQRRLAWAEAEAAIARLKEREFYTKVAVSKEEMEKRYQEEIARPEQSKIVKPVLYISSYPDDDTSSVINMIESGLGQGLSFPEIARRDSLPYDTIEFDSPRFGELPPQIQKVAVSMNSRTVVAAKMGEAILYLVKDVAPLSSSFREVRRVIRNEKSEKAVREWLSSQRARSTIRVHEEAQDSSNTDAVAVEVNGTEITVGDIVALFRGLPEPQRSERASDWKALVDEAIDREILRQEAWKKGVQNDPTIKKNVERESRRILVELLTEQSVSGYTPAAREEARARWVEGLKKAAGVKVFSENVKKMYIPPSREIQEVFGGQSI